MGNRTNQRRKQKKIREKKEMLKKCKLADECRYVSTCPKCGHRICNSNSKCCLKCVEAEFCPMRGTK